MKKLITAASLIGIAFVGTSAFILKSSSGIAGYTGSPGEATCNHSGCHGGGTSAASGITITATPSFTNDEYVPGTPYSITISASATGFSHYGFGCEILNDNLANIGTMQLPGSGVKFLNAGAKKNAVHTTPKTGTTANFTFQWVAPDEGGGNVNIYAAANAVNGNGSTNGDFPITPVSMSLTEGAVPTDTTVVTGIREQEAAKISDVLVYPNPASGITNVSYTLKQSGSVSVELIDFSGKAVKILLSEKQVSGAHSQLLSLQNAAAGVYFVKLLVNGQKVSQKLIAVQ